MKLLVSVRDAGEAEAALEGGADIIDAKDPAAGPLGAVRAPEFRAIVGAVAGLRPVTAALGDASDASALADCARAFVGSGAALVKVGFAGVSQPRCVSRLLAAASEGAAGRVVAVAYADAAVVAAADWHVVLAAARDTGVTGVLIDTANKDGPGLRQLIPLTALRQWVQAARGAGLQVAVAGKLCSEDLPFAFAAGADIVGVRGAACAGDRKAQVAMTAVAQLAQATARLRRDAVRRGLSF